MSILVTGGTGFLGAYLVRHLVEVVGARDVVLFDRAPAPDKLGRCADRVRIVTGDILDRAALAGVIGEFGVDRIAHLAYTLSTGLDADPPAGIRINCEGTVNVFEAARQAGVRRVVFGSSVTMYGMRTELVGAEVDEDTEPHPDSLYGMCKQFDERIAGWYGARHGLEIIAMRPISIFGLGRGQRATSAQSARHFMVLPEIAALGEPVTMPPDEQVIDWMYAADAAHAFHLALTVPAPAHRIFNMASDRVRTGEVTAILRRLLPGVQIRSGTEPVPCHFLVSQRRLREELGYAPRFSLEQALAEYIADARAARRAMPA
ncbi:MAG: NAD-dependent epimerase/dehydratase family protein [Gammaproteobacteria bacterium]